MLKNYTSVPPTLFPNNLIPPTCDGLIIPMCTSTDEDESQIHWLTKVRSITEVSDGAYVNINISWSAYFASVQVSVLKSQAVTALVPMFRDNAHLSALVKHGMHIIKHLTNHVNPGQNPVLTVEYTISKII